MLIHLVKTELLQFKDDEAVTAVEYGLIAAATAVAIIVALGTIKTQLSDIFTSIANAL